MDDLATTCCWPRAEKSQHGLVIRFTNWIYCARPPPASSASPAASTSTRRCPTCAPFEPLRCHAFATEATYALPLFRWDDPKEVARDVLAWWDANRAAGRASVLFCYALGKAQRILAELALATDREAFIHGALQP